MSKKLSQIPAGDFSGGGSHIQLVGVKDSAGTLTDYLFTVDDQCDYAEERGVKHLVGRGGTPSAVVGSAAGTGATVTVTGDDLGGVVSVTTGVGATANGLLARVTFAVAYAAAPDVVMITPASQTTVLLPVTKQCYIDSIVTTSARFDVFTNTTPLTDATTYRWFYLVKQ
jgi:hypothetical protein